MRRRMIDTRFSRGLGSFPELRECGEGPRVKCRVLDPVPEAVAWDVTTRLGVLHVFRGRQRPIDASQSAVLADRLSRVILFCCFVPAVWPLVA